MLIKVMSDEHQLADDDPVKQYVLWDDVRKFNFAVMDSAPYVRVEFSDGSTQHTPIKGNVYVMNEIGDILALRRPKEIDDVAPAPLQGRVAASSTGRGHTVRDAQELANEMDDRGTFDMWMTEALDVLEPMIASLETYKQELEEQIQGIRRTTAARFDLLEQDYYKTLEEQQGDVILIHQRLDAAGIPELMIGDDDA